MFNFSTESLIDPPGVSSPEVDLVFLAEDPLVLASQVRHTKKFLQQGNKLL